MNVNIMVFGQLKDILSCDSLTVKAVSDINSLQTELHLQFPALANIKYAIAIDKRIAHENISLNDDNEIALFPPFSGG